MVEQAGMNQGDDYDFTRYFRDGTKTTMLIFTREISVEQYWIERLKEENHEVNPNWTTVNILFSTKDLLVSCMTITSLACALGADTLCIYVHE